MEAPRCASIGKWVNKLLYPDNVILFSAKKKAAIKPSKDMEESAYYEVKEANQKRLHTVWFHLWHSGKANLLRQYKDWWLTGDEEGGDEQVEHTGF